VSRAPRGSRANRSRAVRSAAAAGGGGAASAPVPAPASGAGRVLALEGELTVQTAADRRAVLAALLGGPGDLDLDLSAVTELDTAGLQLLLLARREIGHAGARLTVSAASRAVTEVLAIAGMNGRLEPLTGPVEELP